MRAVFLALVLTTSACAVNSTFRPTMAVRGEPCMAVAVVAYEDDIPLLEAAGGRRIGTISSEGNGFTNLDDLQRDVAETAARNGGTHVILAASRYNTSRAQISGGSAQTTCSPNGDETTCNTSYTPPTYMNVNKPQAYYVVVRVDPENWERIPLGRGMRPLQPASR